MKTVTILPSKSDAHRALICRTLAAIQSGQEPAGRVLQAGTSRDIMATQACLTQLQEACQQQEQAKEISAEAPVGTLPETGAVLLPCGESGSTLRLLLPIVCALGVKAVFRREGRLPQRPLAPLDAELIRHGAVLTDRGGPELQVDGRLQAGDYELPGNVSSQFVSGLLLALPLLTEESRIRVRKPLESSGYVAMTLRTLQRFGITVAVREEADYVEYRIPGGQRWRMERDYAVEGDWSNAAFWLTAGAISGEGISVRGLTEDTPQGDRGIVEILRRFGAEISCADGEATVLPRPASRLLQGQTVDASQIPDLVPVVALLGACAAGETKIIRAGRLRLKESDRLRSVATVLRDLGAAIEEAADELILTGSASPRPGEKPLAGGRVDGFADHRIVMMAAIAALAAEGSVRIEGSKAVEKSYPDFFSRLFTLWPELAGRVVPA
ncbi:MAG: 3-phosphoshikimate 1-carboxyvinyltransferase [Firmicutes bacterium]|nr:3-phosphoshikimate 1-carboxyvinyltransferase [Bacillota bacterium]